MATIFEWNDGAAPTTGGATVTVDGSVGYPDPPGILVEQQSSQIAVARWDPGSIPTGALRFYFHTPTAWPGASANIAAFKVGGTSIVAQFSIAGTGAPGQVRLVRTGGAQQATSPTGTIEVDTTYRVELQLDTANSQARAAVFPLASDTALWDSGWQSNAAFATVPNRVEIGSLNTMSPPIGTFWVDTILATDSTADWIGRAPGDGSDPTGYALTIWDGANEVPAVLTYWDGANEVPYVIEGVAP